MTFEFTFTICGFQIAPSFYSSLMLYISHGNSEASDKVYVRKPIVTTPGDDSPGAIAFVGLRLLIVHA